MNESNLKNLKFYAIIPLIASLFFANLYLIHFNSIKNRGDWKCPEAITEIMMAHGVYFCTDSITLAQGTLDMGVWHGNNELLTQGFSHLKKLKIRFKLTEDSYLAMYFENEAKQSAGIRLSNTDLFPVVSFEKNISGEFTKKNPLSFSFSGTEWQQIEFDLDKEPFNLSNTILGNPQTAELKFGIRNGSRSALVDSVELLDDHGDTVFYDNFYWNKKHFFKAFSISFLFLFSVLLLITMFAKSKTSVYYFLAAISTLAAISVLVWCSFYFYFSHMYPIAQSNIAPPTLTYSYRWIHSSSSLEHSTDYQKLLYGKISLPKIMDRIIFFGSSQTFGEGSRVKSESWANTLFLKLKDSPLVSNNFVMLNKAQKGSFAIKQKELLLAMSDIGKNDLIIIDLGNNDRSPVEFKKNITEMLDFIKLKASNTLLVLEPNDPQINSSHLEENHKILKELCASYQVPCFDMHRYLMSPGVFDTGFMWWDHVHPTSYGHSLIADVLGRLLISRRR